MTEPTKETQKAAENMVYNSIKAPETKKLDQLSNGELLVILAKWRNKIKIEEIIPDEVNLEMYLVLVIDELFKRVENLNARLKSFEPKETETSHD